MGGGSRHATMHLSLPVELKEWLNRTGATASTLFTALLYIMSEAGVSFKGRNVEAAKRAIIKAVLANLGMNITDERLNELISGRKRLFIGEV